MLRFSIEFSQKFTCAQKQDLATHLDCIYLQLPLFLFWSVHINHMQVHFQVCPVCAEVNYLMHCRVQEMITYWMIIYV